MNASQPNDSLVISYLALRKGIGLLGLALPPLLALGAIALGGRGVQESLSAYYYTIMRDAFVGILCALGVFLFSYRGYERRDDIAGKVAAAFAVGVAFVPTTPSEDPTTRQMVLGGIHLVSAAAFFLTLSYFSLVLFTKTDPSKPPTTRKLLRNRVYQVCGYAMLAALVLIVVVKAALTFRLAGDALARLAPVFWLESIAVWAFGFAWLTKGEAILADQG